MPPLKALKKQKKYLQFYRTYFGYYKPYKVIVDPDFIREVRRKKMHMKVHLMKVFQLTAYPLVTRCTAAFIKRMAPGNLEWAGAKEASRKFQVLGCGHPAGAEIDPYECIKHCLENPPKEGNGVGDGKFVLGVFNDELRRHARGRLGQPLVILDVSRFALDRPTKRTKAHAKQMEADKIAAQKRSGELESKPAGTQEGEQLGLPLPPAKKHKTKAKGPNPLSVRKKHAKRPLDQDATDGESASKKQRQQEQDGENGSGAAKPNRKTRRSKKFKKQPAAAALAE